MCACFGAKALADAIAQLYLVGENHDNEATESDGFTSAARCDKISAPIAIDNHMLHIEDPAAVLTDSSKVQGLAETLGGLALAANLAEQPDVKAFTQLL